MVYPDHPLVPVQEDNVDCKLHKEHMHPHERLEPSTYERHPMAGFESLSSQPAGALTAKTARIFEPIAQDSRTGFVPRAQYSRSRGLAVLAARGPIVGKCHRLLSKRHAPS